MFNKRFRIKHTFPTLLALMPGMVFPLITNAQRTEDIPHQLEGVDIVEHLNAKLPLDAELTNSEGKTVRLGDYFDGKHPVILTLGYYRCPMLCDLVLQGVVDGIKELDWTVGDQFRIVTISFDHLETPILAKENKQGYLRLYGRAEAASGWSFHVGREENIARIAETVGFGFKWNEARKEYAHKAGIMICTPDGHISRYLYNIVYEPQTLRMALLEASEGKIGSTIDQFVLYCYHYDSSEGRYAPVAQNIMRLGGVLTLLIVAIGLGAFWLKEWSRKKNRLKEVNPDVVG